MTAIIIVGVNKPITLDTLSTSSRPVTRTRTIIAVDPTQVGQPNCWAKLEPAPASMTKPTAKSVKITATSNILETIGCDTFRNTALCSEAWKYEPSCKNTVPAKVMM